jgi:hypothetical protein
LEEFVAASRPGLLSRDRVDAVLDRLTHVVAAPVGVKGTDHG